MSTGTGSANGAPANGAPSTPPTPTPLVAVDVETARDTTPAPPPSRPRRATPVTYDVYESGLGRIMRDFTPADGDELEPIERAAVITGRDVKMLELRMAEVKARKK